jgi:hypothetical protein
MGSNFAPLLENINVLSLKLGLRSRFIVLLDQIRQVQRATQPRRTRSNNQHIRLELFSLYVHVVCILSNWEGATSVVP